MVIKKNRVLQEPPNGKLSKGDHVIKCDSRGRLNLGSKYANERFIVVEISSGKFQVSNLKDSIKETMSRYKLDKEKKPSRLLQALDSILGNSDL
jgi:hypothetical protein